MRQADPNKGPALPLTPGPLTCEGTQTWSVLQTALRDVCHGHPLFGDRETEAGHVGSPRNRTRLGSEDSCACGLSTCHALEVRQCGKLDAVVTSAFSFSENVLSQGGRVSGFHTPRSSLRGVQNMQMPLPIQAQAAPSWEMPCPAAGPCPVQPSRVASRPSRRHQKERTVRGAAEPTIHSPLA